MKTKHEVTISNKEKAKKIKEYLKDQDVFELYDVRDINHKPHPYCITSKHITGKYMHLNGDVIRELEKDGKAHCGMYTSPDGTKYRNGYKKGWQPCHVPYDEHTADNVAIFSLKRNTTKLEASKILKNLVEHVGEDFVDGVSFAETKEEFRIS